MCTEMLAMKGKDEENINRVRPAFAAELWRKAEVGNKAREDMASPAKGRVQRERDKQITIRKPATIRHSRAKTGDLPSTAQASLCSLKKVVSK